VRHLDATDKSELHKLQLLKDELGVSLVICVLDCHDALITLCICQFRILQTKPLSIAAKCKFMQILM
jgi:hypothetical protein